MNILSDTYIFYADVYFIQNFIMKIAVLYLSLYCNKFHLFLKTIKGIRKIILSAFIGTVMEIIGLFLGNSYNLFVLLVHLLEIPLMIWFVLRKERPQMFRVVITGYLFVMMINGVLEVLWNWFGYYGNYLFLLCAACAMTYIGVRILQNYNRMQKGIFPVELLHKGKTIVTYGFYDSGNQLIDPYTQKGVHIVSNSILSHMKTDTSKGVYLPYHALGNEKGLLKVYYLEHIRIQGVQKIVEETEVPVGIAEDALFQNKRYQMILNANIW